MPSASGQTVDVAHASDAEFQSWLEISGLSELVDDDGIAEWSFDDRVRLLNFALRHGYALKFVEDKNNSNNSPNNSDSALESELFGEDKLA